MAATLPNLEPIIAAGIDPKTGLPVKLADPSKLKQDIKKTLRIVDEQDAINRYYWNDLPKGLNGQLIERILYYKGQGMLFKIQDQYFFLPYTLSGNIDVYGRFTQVTPIPFNGSTKDLPWIPGLDRVPVYDIEDPMDENSCILLSDYSKQISQTVLSRQVLNDPILDVMADIIPFCRTAMMNSTGVQAMRVNAQDEYSNVLAANKSINDAALNGQRFIPVVGALDFQDLAGGDIAKAEEFFQTMQSLDNFRRSLLGLDNGGLFEKKTQELQSEDDINGKKASTVYEDGLKLRQEFCELANKAFGLNISVEDTRETETQEDQNNDEVRELPTAEVQ